MTDPHDEELSYASGEGDLTSGPEAPTHMYAYITRAVKPSSWNRKTRWGNATRLLPSPPDYATQHIRQNWGWMLARVILNGWAFCRDHEKQEPAWYVDFAKMLATGEVLKHIGRCHLDCGEDSWLWLLEKTDKTPTLDATPFPAPYYKRR